ncbi:ATP-binding protein [Actinokineospora auranticolor]|uniref:ATP-binding protein n=1 Tax=Actinokineospora auranticolor TaxID=155976 RepID=UPI0011B01DDD|nr:ATP-binding protein [Actinokineospora auranticolor]
MGRTEQWDRIRAVTAERAFGPLVIGGAAGSGRSTALTGVLRELDGRRLTTVRLRPAGAAPFALLRPVLTTAPADHDAAVAALATALAARARGGRGLVVGVDDAHLADQASLLALRALSRRGDLALLLTRPSDRGPGRGPDPTDCLRYEPGMRVVQLAALSEQDVAAVLAGLAGGPTHPTTAAALHAASGGNPRRLRELVVDGGLVACLGAAGEQAGPGTGTRRLCEPPGDRAATLADADADALVAAARLAWRELALDRVEELCRLAGWHGVGDQVSTLAATAALLRGRPGECARVLDTVHPGRAGGAPPGPRADAAQRALTRAMCVGLGSHRVGDAAAILDAEAAAPGVDTELVESYRDWLLAVTARPVRVPDPTAAANRETALFRHAALAALATAAGHPATAVAHLRRGLVAAAGCLDTVPWMTPLLTACLIDALLLSARISEATELAGEFHAGKPGCGWEVAVGIAALVNGTLGTPAGREVRAA